MRIAVIDDLKSDRQLLISRLNKLLSIIALTEKYTNLKKELIL